MMRISTLSWCLASTQGSIKSISGVNTNDLANWWWRVSIRSGVSGTMIVLILPQPTWRTIIMGLARWVKTGMLILNIATHSLRTLRMGRLLMTMMMMGLSSILMRVSFHWRNSLSRESRSRRLILSCRNKSRTTLGKALRSPSMIVLSTAGPRCRRA